jgi:hypothetical protein
VGYDQVLIRIHFNLGGLACVLVLGDDLLWYCDRVPTLACVLNGTRPVSGDPSRGQPGAIEAHEIARQLGGRMEFEPLHAPEGGFR